jgi:Leucine-rich repeat (LRR) protein
VLLLIAFAWAGAAWGAIPVAERDALVDLYGDTGGPTWVNSTNWLGASGTEGTWFGITVELVDGGDHVTGIELAENNLTGNLPADFNAFTRLRILDLHWNYGLTSGPIPDCSSCASLQTLDLDDCVRTETSFPSWIPNLSSLQVLSLNFNDLSGPLPPNLWTVTTLTKLDLGVQNQYDDTHGFSGTISQDVTDLVNLTYLDLSYNHFTGTLPDLSSMTQLRTLFLGVNPVDSQEFPAWIASMSGLTQLGLEQLGLTGSIPASIGNLTQLTLLSLESNPFDPGPAPGELALLTHLEQLDLRACNLTSLPDLSPLTALNRLYLGSNPLAAGPVPTWVVSLTLLEIFQMVGCNLIGTIPEGLCTLPNLYYIHLADNDLTGPIPSQIGNLASLRYLYLNGNNLTGGIPPSLGNCPLLRFLFLHDNQLTGNLPSALGNCTALRYLYANDNLLSGAIPPEI